MEKSFKVVIHSSIMKNVKLVTVVFLLLIYSCKSNSLVQKLTSIDEITFKRNKINRIVFKMLRDSLMDADHIIYIKNYINHLPSAINTKDFDGLVYDYRQNKTFYIRNKDLKALDIRFEQYSPDLNVINSILKYYLTDKISYLKSFENTDISEAGLWTTYLYDIDLKQNQIKKYSLESMTFNKTGAPVSFNDFMKGLKQ